MALTNSLLKSFGLEQDQRDAIMTEHQATLESIKAERDELRDKAAKVPDLEGQIEALKAADKGDEWKAKYDELSAAHEKLKEADDKLQADYDSLRGEKANLEGEFESYKQGVEADKANALKLEAYKGLLREIGLDEKRVEKASGMKALDELEIGEDGKLANYEELKAAEAEEWALFIPQPQGIQGQQVATPPKPEPAKPGSMPSIEDANPRAVQIAQERHEKLYGKSEE